MICKHCGTESREDFCPRCGEMLRPGTVPSTPAPPVLSAPPVTPTEAETPPASKKKKKEKRKEKQKERKAKKIKISIPFKEIIWPAVALLLPLAYLFFDAVVILSERLFTANGAAPLPALVQKLCDPLYANNSLQELLEASFGESFALFSSFTPLSVIKATAQGRAMMGMAQISLLLQLILLAGCVLSALLLLVSAGKLLRSRFFTALAIFFGMGATFSPLLCNAVLHIAYCVGRGPDGADLLMQPITPSIEALCLMGILACVVVPALCQLSRVAADARCEKGAVLFPCHFLLKAPFGFTKWFAFVAVMLSAAFIIVMTFLPISDFGTIRNLSEVFHADWGQIALLWQELPRGEGGAALSALAGLLLRVAGLWWIPIAFVAVICLVVAAVQILTLKKNKERRKKAGSGMLTELGTCIRCGLIAPYACFVLVQGLLVFLALLATPMQAHLDLANAQQTLSLLYLTIAHIGSLGGTGTLYIFLAMGGTALGFVADQSGKALLWRGNRKK